MQTKENDMIPKRLLRFCPLLLPILLSLSAFQSAFAQAGAPALNLSTRVYLEQNTDAIAGFIITGTGGGLKTVVVRGIGPSLALLPMPLVPDIDDPVLGKNNLGDVINDNWSDPTIPVTLQPGSLESAAKMDLGAGHYTAVLSGQTATQFGFALVEVYDLTSTTLKLANISTRAFVGVGDNIVIAGFILDDSAPPSAMERVVLRGLGPSLLAQNVPNVLANPVLELRDGTGTPLLANDNWEDDPVQAADIIALGLAPSNSLEAALIITLPPGRYTGLLSGLGSSTGNGLVEIYDLGPP
jgi:hypothetical protein